MKNVLLAFVVLILCSCGGDDANKDNLLGAWDLVQLNADGMTTTDEEVRELALTSGSLAYVVTFTEGSYVTNGAYDLTTEFDDGSGVPDFITLSYTNTSASGTYDLSDNKIEALGPLIGIQIGDVNLGVDVGVQDYSIESLSEMDMILVNTINKNETDGDLPTAVELEVRTVWRKR